MLYKYRLPIAITLVLLISAAIGIPIAIQNLKIDQFASTATSTQTIVCDDRGSAQAAELETEWQEYVKGLSLTYSGFISPLHFEDAQSYFGTKCTEARALSSEVQTTTTDAQKVSIYNRAYKLSQEAKAEGAKLQASQLTVAMNCIDAYKKVEDREKSLNRIDPYGDSARNAISTGSWGDCSFYSTQATQVLSSVQSCTENIAKAETLETELNVSDSNANQARTFRDQQSWQFCDFYATQALKTLQSEKSCVDTLAKAEVFEHQYSIVYPAAEQARAYKQQSNWISCTYFAQQALNGLQAIPTPTQ